MTLFTCIFLFLSDLHAESKYRWQTSSFITEAYFGQQLNTKIYLWPDEPVDIKHYRLSVVQGIGNDRGAQVRNVLAKSEKPLPIDLKVLIDIGNKPSDWYLKKSDVEEVMKDIIDSYSTAPEGSTISIHTFPYNYTQASEDKIGYITKKETIYNSNLLLTQSSAWDGALDFLDVSDRTEYSDLGKGLIEVMQSFSDFDAQKEDRIRMIFYISTGRHTYGNASKVAEESLKAGNVFIFPFIAGNYDVHNVYSNKGKGDYGGGNYTTKAVTPGYMSGGGFHLAVTDTSGTWILSDNISTTAKSRERSMKSYYNTWNQYNKKLRSYNKLISQIDDLKSQVASYEMDISNGKSYLAKTLRQKMSQLEKKEAQLASESKPVEPKPELTSFGEHLSGIYKTFSTPLIASSEVPCAQGSLTGDRNFRFALEVGKTLDKLNPISLWSSAGGGGSNFLSVYPSVGFDTPIPEIENVMIWSDDGQIEQAGRTGKDKLTLSRDWLVNSGEGLLYVVQGKNLCGDARLEVRADQHNGMEGVPHTFDEGRIPNSFSEKPNSERRVFRINNLSNATHSLKSRLIFRRDLVRTLPGGDISLPTVYFKISFFEFRWVSGVIVIILGLLGSIFGLQTFSRKFDLQRSQVNFDDQNDSNDSSVKEEDQSDASQEKESPVDDTAPKSDEEASTLKSDDDSNT